MKHKAVIRVITGYRTLRSNGERKYLGKHVVRNVWGIEQIREDTCKMPIYDFPAPRWALGRTWKEFRGRARIDNKELNVFFFTFDDFLPVYGGASSEGSWFFPEDLSSWGWFNLHDHPKQGFFVNPRMTMAGLWIAKSLDLPNFFGNALSDRCPLCYHVLEHQVCDMCFARGLDHECPDCEDVKPEWHECVGCGWKDDEDELSDER